MMVTSYGFFLAAVGLSATSPRSPPLRFGLLWAFRCNPSRGNTVIGSFGKKLKSYSSVLYPYPPHLAPIEVEILFEKGTWAVAELPFSKDWNGKRENG
jgi:hypothetical protein